MSNIFCGLYGVTFIIMDPQRYKTIEYVIVKEKKSHCGFSVVLLLFAAQQHQISETLTLKQPVFVSTISTTIITY